jgi:hypothetical protein
MARWGRWGEIFVIAMIFVAFLLAGILVWAVLFFHGTL